MVVTSSRNSLSETPCQGTVGNHHIASEIRTVHLSGDAIVIAVPVSSAPVFVNAHLSGQQLRSITLGVSNPCKRRRKIYCWFW
jgi:hypothetical protein